jgi:hypothetical protein
MTKIQMTETVLCDIRFRNCYLVCLFLTLEHYSFEFVSDFDIRISNLNNLYHRSRYSQKSLISPDGLGFRKSLKASPFLNWTFHINIKSSSVLVAASQSEKK